MPERRSIPAFILAALLLGSIAVNLRQSETTAALSAERHDLLIYVNLNRSAALKNAELYQDCLQPRRM